MNIKLSKPQLMSALSLHIFAAGKSEVAAAIRDLQFQQTGERLDVVATDRYMAAWGQYRLSGDTVHTNSEPHYLNASDAKTMTTFFKAWPETELITVDDRGIHMGADSVFPWSTASSKYPEIKKLFNRELGTPPDTIGVKPSMVAKLDKVVMPNSGRPDRNVAWRLQFHSTPDAMGNPKPGPIECYRPGQQGDVTVLIQPSLLTNY